MSILIGIAAAAALNGSFANGNALLADCDSSVGYDRGACSGYISGVSDAIASYQTVHAFPDFVCMPDQVQRGQIIDVVVKYLRDHPEKRHLGAASMVTAALRLAFPCE